MYTILGLDIGGTKTAVVEGTYTGEILQRLEIPTLSDRPVQETFPRITDLMKEVIINAAASERFVNYISVSIGGPLSIKEGVMIDPPHLMGWHGFKLKDHLQSLFPLLPVDIEHDGNAGALAEYYFGAGKGREDVRHLIFLTFGTGFGAGLIVNGEVVYGASDTAGEIGHLRLSKEGLSGFGKKGSWEGLASGSALAKHATLRNPTRWPKGTSIREVVEAMLNDDPEALAIAREAGEWMGHGIALLVDTLNPQFVVLGSLAVVLGDRILGPVREVVSREALPQAVAACTIQATALGKQIGDVASLMAAISRMEPLR